MSPIGGGPYSLQELEGLFPWINWRKPKSIALIDNPEEKHYACPVCIANIGVKGHQIPDLPTDPEEVRLHITQEHE